MGDAPQVTDDKFAAPGKFDQQSQKVDAYRKRNLTVTDLEGYALGLSSKYWCGTSSLSSSLSPSGR